MGGLAAGELDKTQSGHSPPLRTTSIGSQKFNNSSFKKHHKSSDLDLEVHHHDINNGEEETRESRCNLCCAWASLIVGTFMLILLLLGVIFFSFIESNMPDFYLNSLTVNDLQFNTIGKDILMDSDIEVALNSTNKDNNIELYYSHMRAEIYSSGVFWGRVHLSGFHQKANNSTLLKLHTKLDKQPVAEADYLKLQNDLQYHQLVVDVDLKGYIHYQINGKQIKGFPFRVSCIHMIQYEVDKKQLSCHVKMTPLT